MNAAMGCNYTCCSCRYSHVDSYKERLLRLLAVGANLSFSQGATDDEFCQNELSSLIRRTPPLFFL